MKCRNDVYILTVHWKCVWICWEESHTLTVLEFSYIQIHKKQHSFEGYEDGVLYLVLLGFW